MSEPNVVPAGKLLVFSSGEYSDYGYEGHFLALEEVGQKEFDEAKANIRKRIEADGSWREYDWDEPTPVSEMDESDWNRALRDCFIGELIRMGKLMAIDLHEFHLGGYGELYL